MNTTEQTSNHVLEKQLEQLLINSTEENAIFFENPAEQIICFCLAISQQKWLYCNVLLSLFVEQQSINKVQLFPPMLGGVLWNFYKNAPNEIQGLQLLEKNFEIALTYHQYLYSNYDKDENGLIHEEKVIAPFFQSILAWSNQSLIKIGHLLGKDTTEIILWNELSIYSCQEKIWDVKNSHFQQLKNGEVTQESHHSFSPLFGNILIQEDAENLLVTMQKKGYPLEEGGGKAKVASNFKLSPSAGYVLLLGLQNYDMEEAADCLKAYLLEVLGATKEMNGFDAAVWFLLNE